MRRADGLRRALAAAAALLLLVAGEAGIPLALLRLVGWPFPHSWPGWQRAWEQLQTNGISNAILFDVLALVVWIGWAYLTIALVTEIVAEVRGLPVATRRSLGPLQPVVGALVATIVIALTVGWARSGTSAARPLTPLAAPLTTAPSPAGENPSPGLPVTIAATAPNHPGALTSSAESSYTVRRGDSLWRIAGQRLQDVLRWPQIWQRNRGRQEPGGRVFSDANLILPGWQLDLPATAAAANPLPSSNPPPVGAGEGDGNSSSGPSVGPPAIASSAAPTAVAVPTEDGRPSPGGPASTPAPGLSHSAPSGPPAPQPPLRDSNGSEPSGRGPISLPMGGALTTTLAGAVLAALAAARLHQRRRRPLGSQPDGVADGVAALPTIASLRRKLPSAAPDDANTSGSVADIQVGSTEASLNDVRSREAHVTIPAGIDAHGRDVAIDLLDLAGVALDGPGADDAVRAIVVGLLAQHDTAHAELLLIGSSAALIHGLPDAPGVTAAALGPALTTLEEQVLRRSRILAQRNAPSYRELIDGDDPPQALLVVARTEEAGAHVQALAAIGERLGISVVAVGELEGLRPLHVQPDGTLNPALGEAARLSVLPTAAAADLLAAVVAGRGGIPVAAAGPSSSPTQLGILDVPLHATHGGTNHRPVEIRLFGGVRVLVNGREVTTGLRRTSRMLLALLAVRPQGVTMDEALDLLWHEEGRPDAGRTDFHAAVNTARGRIRDLLGTQHPMVISYVADHYRLDTDVVDVDLWSFGADLQRAALASDDTTRRDCLEHACAIVAGEPLAGLRGHWAEPVREELRRRAVDALVRLAELREGAGQIDAAIEALQAACAADPYEEALARRLIRLQLAHGRREAAERSYRVLAVRLAELDTEPDDETEDLLAGAQHDEVVNMAARRTGTNHAATSRVAIVDNDC